MATLENNVFFFVNKNWPDRKITGGGDRYQCMNTDYSPWQMFKVEKSKYKTNQYYIRPLKYGGKKPRFAQNKRGYLRDVPQSPNTQDQVDTQFYIQLLIDNLGTENDYYMIRSKTSSGSEHYRKMACIPNTNYIKTVDSAWDDAASLWRLQPRYVAEDRGWVARHREKA